MKYIISAAFCSLCVTAVAQNDWARDYEYAATLPIQVESPTVVQVPIDSVSRHSVLLRNGEPLAHGTQITNVPVANTPSFVVTQPTQADPNGLPPTALLDRDAGTYFLLAEGDTAQVVLETLPDTSPKALRITFGPTFRPEVQAVTLTLDDGKTINVPPAHALTANKKRHNPNNIALPDVPFNTVTITFDTTNVDLLGIAAIETELRSTRRQATVNFVAEGKYDYTLYWGLREALRQAPQTPASLKIAPPSGQPLLWGEAFVEQANPAFDPDYDGDGVPDTDDLCPRIANADQADTDQNALGDACEDPDRDGIVTADDNCPAVSNAGQTDSDQDGTGNACDDADDRWTETSNWGIWAIYVLIIGVIGWVLLPKRNTKTDAA